MSDDGKWGWLGVGNGPPLERRGPVGLLPVLDGEFPAVFGGVAAFIGVDVAKAATVDGFMKVYKGVRVFCNQRSCRFAVPLCNLP